jgi:thioredoxin 1
MEFNLSTLPAIVFMKRGREVDMVVGVKVDELERKLNKYTQSFF